MGRRGQSLTLSISDRDKAQLEELATELGIMWGDRPNISKLLEAIARRQLLIAPNNDWTEPRLKALTQAVHALTDAGQTEAALAIANLLLLRSELSIPLRREIERFLENPPPPWRLEIDRYIHRQQPFQLSYQDATGRLWSFTVRHAKITPHEERQYLDCWCDEKEGNQDLPELVHNWSLRLERIVEAVVAPVEGDWCSGLDQLEVEVYLFRRLAFTYKAKSEDIDDEWLADRQQVRRVVRRISSTYWFIREVLQHAEDCVVVAPQSVRDRLKQKVRNLCDLYEIETRD